MRVCGVTSASKWLTAMLSEQLSAFVFAEHSGSYSTSAGFLCLCTFVCQRVCTFLYIRLSGQFSAPNGLIGALWRLSNPLVWDTLRARGSTKAQRVSGDKCLCEEGPLLC